MLAQVQDRSQRELRLLRLDPRTGKRTRPHPLLVERREGAWVNINTMLRVLKGDEGGGGRNPYGGEGSRSIKYGDFLWASEKTGYAHLYLHCGDTAGEGARGGSNYKHRLISFATNHSKIQYSEHTRVRHRRWSISFAN